MKITIVGGDERLIKAKKVLSENGFEVDSIGLLDNDNGNADNSDILLFSVPTTRDKINAFAPKTDKKIPLAQFSKYNKKLFLTANYIFDGKRNIDYCKNDYYAILNAIPTAEGAISYAIENTKHTLWKSKILVIGFGRTGKILAERLKSFKCDLTVSARKERDFALLSAMDIKFVNSNHLDEIPLPYDIIFNTVDAGIFDNNLINMKDKLFIDLSSYGGFDTALAEKYGIKYKKLPSIPGKIAPDTAGEILAETVINLIKGEMI